MLNLSFLILLVAGCLILGWSLSLPFIKFNGPFAGDKLSRIFASLILGAAVLGWLALVLAELSVFSLALLAFIWLALVLLFGILAYQRGWHSGPKANTNENTSQLELSKVPSTAQSTETTSATREPLWPKQPSWLEGLLLLLWLIGAGILFLRPHEFVIGAADAGVYVNLAANISRTGSIITEDETLAEIDNSLQPAVLRVLPDHDGAREVANYYLFPGFYVTSPEKGQITPQFYPLHGVWQAIAYSLNGVWPSLMITGLWALLGSLAIYMTVREIAGWEAAYVALLGLTINALQIWFARYPTTEALTQFLLWSSLWATIIWLKHDKPVALWGLIAGLALGQVFLTRIDTYFLLAIPTGIFIWLVLTRRWRASHWWYFVPIIMLTIHSIGHALGQSQPYFFSIFGYGLNLLKGVWILPLGILLVGLVVALLLIRYGRRLNELKRYQRPLSGLAIVTVLGLVLYGWLIRPYLGDEGLVYQSWYGGEEISLALNRQNLLRLGWYISPLGIILATAGICLMIWQIDRQKAVILAAGLMFSLLYLWRIQANPHQIYAMRRYVPAVMPFAIVASGYLFGWLFRQGQGLKIAGALLVVAWLISLALSARGFVEQVDYRGIITQLDELNERLPPSSVLIFNSQEPITPGDFVGTPLRFLYGHDAYSLRDPESLDPVLFRETVEQWQAAGRTVYWVGDRDLLAILELANGQPILASIGGPQLENTYDHKPREIVPARWDLELVPIE